MNNPINKLEEIGTLADRELAKVDTHTFHQWLQQRRNMYNKNKFGECECGKSATKEYSPYCSYHCWSKKHDQ